MGAPGVPGVNPYFFDVFMYQGIIPGDNPENNTVGILFLGIKPGTGEKHQTNRHNPDPQHCIHLCKVITKIRPGYYTGSFLYLWVRCKLKQGEPAGWQVRPRKFRSIALQVLWKGKITTD